MNSIQTPLLTPKEINEHRRILLGFDFSEEDLRTNAQSALAANMPMTLGVHTRVLARTHQWLGSPHPVLRQRRLLWGVEKVGRCYGVPGVVQQQQKVMKGLMKGG
jgi:hypothetical protein